MDPQFFDRILNQGMYAKSPDKISAVDQKQRFYLILRQQIRERFFAVFSKNDPGRIVIFKSDHDFSPDSELLLFRRLQYSDPIMIFSPDSAVLLLRHKSLRYIC